MTQAWRRPRARAVASWCPTATVVEAGTFGGTAYTLAGGVRLDQVEIGSAALWGDEIVRVVSLDISTGAVVFGRGCADTVPQSHAAGERIWFITGDAAIDSTEYVSGETLAVKLLTNTGSQQLDIAVAAAMSVPFSGRQIRPYPPGKLLINGSAYPQYIKGALSLSWAHRDRLTQADQLVDTTSASIGPEAGTTYTARLYGETDTLLRTYSGLTGTGVTWTAEEADSSLTIGGETGSIDPYWSSVSALLHFNGANGSTAFIDEKGHLFTASGNAQISTAQSVFGGASGAFDGSGDYVSTPNSDDFNFGTGDFTIELAVRFASLPVNSVVSLVSAYLNSTTGLSIQYRTDGGSGNRLTFGVGDTSNNFAWSPATGTWYRVAVTRSGTSLRAFIDGTQIGSTITNSSNLNSTAALWIGALNFSGGVQFLNGWIDEMRITNGVARYTSNYTIASDPFQGTLQRLNNIVRAEVESLRSGYTSMQKHNYTARRVGYGYSYGYSYGGI